MPLPVCEDIRDLQSGRRQVGELGWDNLDVGVRRPQVGLSGVAWGSASLWPGHGSGLLRC